MGLKSLIINLNRKESYWAHCQILRSTGEFGKYKSKKLGMGKNLGSFKIIIFNGI